MFHEHIGYEKELRLIFLKLLRIKDSMTGFWSPHREETLTLKTFRQLNARFCLILQDQCWHQKLMKTVCMTTF